MTYSRKTNQIKDNLRCAAITCCTGESVRSSPGTLRRCWPGHVGMWMPFESNHPLRHSCRLSTPPHGNSNLQSVAPHRESDPTKTEAHGVNFTAKEFNLIDLRHVRSGPTSRCSVFRPQQVTAKSDPQTLKHFADCSRCHISLSLHLHLVFSVVPDSGCLPARTSIPRRQQINVSYKSDVRNTRVLKVLLSSVLTSIHTLSYNSNAARRTGILSSRGSVTHCLFLSLIHLRKPSNYLLRLLR